MQWLEDGSGVKNIGCFSKGPRFNSKNPHGSSKLSVTTVLRIQYPHLDIHADKIPMHIKINKS